MKKTLNIDAELLREARAACGASTDTDAVRMGLEALVQRAVNQRLRSYLGSEAGRPIIDAPRRREKPLDAAKSRPSSKRRAA